MSQEIVHRPTIILTPPQYPWLDRLRRGHVIHLPKEQVYARVCFAWEPPEPGCMSGRMGIAKVINNTIHHIENWFVDIYGCGLDGSQIILPVRDNLPEEAAPIAPVWQRDVEKALAILMHRLDELETSLSRMWC